VNIKRYRKLLRDAQDAAGRRRILKLLAEAEQEEHAAGEAMADLKAPRESNGRPLRAGRGRDETD
jgi:hypothetical protein